MMRLEWRKQEGKLDEMCLDHEVLQSRMYVNPFLVLITYWHQMTALVLYEYILRDCLEAQALRIKTRWFLPSWNSRQSRKTVIVWCLVISTFSLYNLNYTVRSIATKTVFRWLNEAVETYRIRSWVLEGKDGKMSISNVIWVSSKNIN